MVSEAATLTVPNCIILNESKLKSVFEFCK